MLGVDRKDAFWQISSKYRFLIEFDNTQRPHRTLKNLRLARRKKTPLKIPNETFHFRTA